MLCVPSENSKEFNDPRWVLLKNFPPLQPPSRSSHLSNSYSFHLFINLCPPSQQSQHPPFTQPPLCPPVPPATSAPSQLSHPSNSCSFLLPDRFYVPKERNPTFLTYIALCPFWSLKCDANSYLDARSYCIIIAYTCATMRYIILNAFV